MIFKRAGTPLILAVGLALIVASSAVASPPSRTAVRAHGQRAETTSTFSTPFFNFDLNARTTGSGASGSYSIALLTGEVFVDGTVTCIYPTVDEFGNPGVSISGFVTHSDLGFTGTYYVVGLSQSPSSGFISYTNPGFTTPIDCSGFGVPYLVNLGPLLPILNGSIRITTR